MKKKKKIPVDGTAEIIVNTVLGDLLKSSGLVPDAEPAKEAPRKAPVEPEPPVSMQDLSHAGKIVIRVQRKGMGGKTVTVLTCQGFSRLSLDSLAKEMRKGLGCGSRVEDADIVLQGNVAERGASWLRDRGAKKIVGGF